LREVERMNRIRQGKVALVGLLLLVVAASFAARPQEAGQTFTVCPEGPPACQFQRIQDAINASPDGATIEVASGTYQENLFIFHSLKLIGSGADKTVIKSLSTVAGRDVIRVYGGFAEYPIKVAIEGFTITGVPRRGGAIWMQRVFNISIENDVVDGGGIFLQNASWVEIQGNTFQNSPYGIRVEDSGSITIQGNLFQGNGDGIDIWNSSEVKIQANTIQNNRASGVALPGVTQASIIDNHVKGNRRDGIYVLRFEGSISGNTIRSNVGNGISLLDENQATITNNTIEDNGQSGIQVWNKTAKVSLEANTITNNQWYGIWVADLKNVVTCRLNKVEGNEKGDYAVGPAYPLPPPSEELRQMCEGGAGSHN
jgi:parallel beta-helix repeat protein